MCRAGQAGRVGETPLEMLEMSSSYPFSRAARREREKYCSPARKNHFFAGTMSKFFSADPGKKKSLQDALPRLPDASAASFMLVAQFGCRFFDVQSSPVSFVSKPVYNV